MSKLFFSIISEELLDRILIVKYEDLVTKPKQMALKMYKFMAAENLVQVSSRVASWLVFKPKILTWVNFAMEDFGLFWPFCHIYGSLVYFMDISSILRPFGISCGTFGTFYGYLVYFTHFGMLYQEKSGKPGKLHPMR
jgi:sterol desaturase/sphingolipid hydroxylase (fatty acid hydroxylase superfamily)